MRPLRLFRNIFRQDGPPATIPASPPRPSDRIARAVAGACGPVAAPFNLSGKAVPALTLEKDRPINYPFAEAVGYHASTDGIGGFRNGETGGAGPELPVVAVDGLDAPDFPPASIFEKSRLAVEAA